MLPRNPTRGAVALLALALVVPLAACTSAHQASDGWTSPGQALVDASAATTDTVLMTDPVDDSFTVQVPAGWDSVAYASGGFDVHREVVSSISPDGGTVLFIGDPKSPNYWNPATANSVTRDFANVLEYMELRSYTPAIEYYREWTVAKFGELDGFELGVVEPRDDLANKVASQFAAAGLAAQAIDGAQAGFSYDSELGRVSGIVVGITIDGGEFWTTDVFGLATNRTVEEYLPMLSAMSASKQTKQEWLDRSAANHAQTMAQMDEFSRQLTAQHNANMAWIAQSAAAHQSRMQAIWASNDASMAAYYNRMDAMDSNQQRFVNYINDENTVAGPSGQTWQVATGQTNYYVNPTTGEYVGGDINFGDKDIRALGLNPNDYQQVTIVR